MSASRGRRPAPSEPTPPPSPPRLPYARPSLKRLGDVRSLTLGSSPGIPDSGMGSPEQRQP